MTNRSRIRLGPDVAIDEALRDGALLGAALGDWRSWTTWLAVLRAAFGLTLSTGELEAFAAVAGSRSPPTQLVRELWAIVGRRGGKSKVAAGVAVFLAVFVRHRLSAGEHGLVLVLAASQEQAKVVFGYAKAFLTASPILRQEIDTITPLRNPIEERHHNRDPCQQLPHRPGPYVMRLRFR